MQSTIELEFADGTYTFALPVPQINELQTKSGIGIGGLYKRIFQGIAVVEGQLIYLPQYAEFYLSDILETIRQGLIGGGRGVVDGQEVEVTAALANRLIENYVAGKPILPNWIVAAGIIGACVQGYDPPKDEPAQEPAAEEATAS